jgi:hypothetical protein
MLHKFPAHWPHWRVGRILGEDVVGEESQPDIDGTESPASRPRPRLRGHAFVDDSDDELIVADTPADPPPVVAPPPDSQSAATTSSSE